MLLVILLLFGAKNLPKMARTLGRTLEEFRRAARDVSDEIMQSTDDDPPPHQKVNAAPGKLPTTAAASTTPTPAAQDQAAATDVEPAADRDAS